MKLAYREHQIDNWERLKNVPVAKTAFYLCTKHENLNSIDIDDFEFKFGYSNDVNRRLMQHRCDWGACYHNTIMITSSNPDFSKGFEGALKIGRGQSEFRKTIKVYDRIGSKLITLAEEYPELDLKFYIHQDYNLPSYLNIKFFLDTHYFDRSPSVIYHERVAEFPKTRL